MSESKGRVALGMSGGVDSSASAAVLLSEGWGVVGVTCVFQDDERSEAAVRDARAVCERLHIPHVVRDSTTTFEQCVVAPFVEGYACGITPSPCVGCNASCKIPELIAVADEHGCDRVATGHYARISQHAESGRYMVRTALDAVPDLVGKVLLWFVLAVAVLVGGPFAVGFWLGGVRARSRMKKQAGE